MMKISSRTVRCFVVLFFSFSLCSLTAQTSNTLFKLLPAAQTGIHFNNQLFESDTLNILNQANLYNGGGVGVGDFNRDGYLDLYLVSGSYEIPADHPLSNDRFFLNDGQGRFARATDALPADLTNGSCVKAADFDGDGDLDLFVGGRVVSAAYPTAPRSFLLQNDEGKFTDVTEV